MNAEARTAVRCAIRACEDGMTSRNLAHAGRVTTLLEPHLNENETLAGVYRIAAAIDTFSSPHFPFTHMEDMLVSLLNQEAA